MFQKLIILILSVWLVFCVTGCGDSVVQTGCDCDCGYCDCGDDWEEEERYDDPGEYEGWRD